MKYEEALRKAISCLKLSTSANQHEAALAAAKAQEIIDRYNLRIDDIQLGQTSTEPEETIADFNNDPLHEVCQVDTHWTLRLASIVARMNSCRVYYQTKSSGSAIVKVVGRPSDVSTVRYIFSWLDREVRRITRQECKGHSRKYQIDFRTGVVDTVQRKLDEQRKETYQTVQQEAVNPMALFRIQQSIAKIEAKGAEVDNWMKANMNMEKPKTIRKQAEFSARMHGQKAGEQIRFTKAKGSLKSSSSQLADV